VTVPVAREQDQGCTIHPQGAFGVALAPKVETFICNPQFLGGYKSNADLVERDPEEPNPSF
jgi:hypothetical protein